MLDFTVVIPTYNGANRLPRVLEKLQLQASIESLSWEILVIDNNSTDRTAELIKTYQKSWQFPFALRYSFEPKKGTAFARQLGVKEAQGELIGFIDDDNLPDANWLKEAYLFSQTHPRAGAYGCRIIGEFEVPPPENFEKIAQFLAIRDHGNQPRLFEPEKLRLPPGAGLVVRKIAWVESVAQDCILTGRQGNNLQSGEDYEVLLQLYKHGWEIWYNPQMSINHYIPSHRLSKDYLLPLAKGIGLATCQLRMILAKNWQKPLIWLKTILGNLRRIVLHCLKHGFRFKDDLVASFELAFFWGSFLSPFYYLQQIFKLKQ
jgi:glycosyltransferase involved in cell wall biosynthesis